MGRRRGLPSIFRSREATSSSSSSFSHWPWPSCKNPKTLSFRESKSNIAVDLSETFSMESEASAVESVIRGLRSDRLIFEPGASSIVGERNRGGATPALEGSVAVELESEDPYGDFRASMAEVVAARGVMAMEEMLGWYLRANARETHGIILQAFFDLLLMLPSSLHESSSSSSSTPLSSSFEIEGEDESGSS